MKELYPSGRTLQKTLKITWSTPTDKIKLEDDEVHVWRAGLDIPEWQIQQLEQTLSPDEKERAERFCFDKHKRRFIVCRSFLRIILGRYLNLRPEQVQFCYSPRGKPEIANNVSSQWLRFNLSHSNEMALYAITHGHLVGIDIECIRPSPDAEALSKRFFSPRESSEIKSLSANRKQEAFYKYWTLKEAYLKATGEGLTGLEQVEVSLYPMNLLALQKINRNTQKSNDWITYQLIPSPGYIAAIVLEEYELNSIRFWDIGKASGEKNIYPLD